jgi:bifunctional DNase/RNase
MIEVSVAGMILDQQSQGPILLLHIPTVDRYLPVWIGTNEAASISMALKRQRFERPLTHDLLVTVIDGLEGEVTRVTITALRDNTFYAKIFIKRGQQVIGIDARPSDSIAVAIRAGAPIYIAEEVVEKERAHLLELDQETTRQILRRSRPDEEAGPAAGAGPGDLSAADDEEDAPPADDEEEEDEEDEED